MVKHGGGGVMLWDCFAKLGQDQFAVIDRTMNSAA